MNEIINENTAKTTQEDIMDMPFEELLARSLGGRADEFQMEIEVINKTVIEREDKYGQPYYEIVVDYVTIATRKHKTKKTRPSFPDGKLIWEEISKEAGVQYVVTLTRSTNPKKPFYDWTEIVRLDIAGNRPGLIEAVTMEDEGEPEAANEPMFDAVDGEGRDSPATDDVDTAA